MDKNKRINKDIEWALSDKARECIDTLVILGLDRDLAISMIEKLVPENEVFNLDEVL